MFALHYHTYSSWRTLLQRLPPAYSRPTRARETLPSTNQDGGHAFTDGSPEDLHRLATKVNDTHAPEGRMSYTLLWISQGPTQGIIAHGTARKKIRYVHVWRGSVTKGEGIIKQT